MKILAADDEPIALRNLVRAIKEAKPDATAGIVKWPMSVIRLNGEDVNRIISLSDKILDAWRSYTDEEAIIYSDTDGEPHNTITPIVRMIDGKYWINRSYGTCSIAGKIAE